MAFNYDRIRKKRESVGTEWTAYSDLFMCLSFLFLMMYVSMSLRSGTDGAKTKIQLAQAEQKIQDMQEEMRAYDSLKQEYLKTGASAQEQKMYKNLMERLALLQDESNKEKEALEQKAQENADKADALNQYQKIIRNIINSNMISQARIKRREEIIGAKENQIQELQGSVQEKELAIQQNNRQIAQIENDLENKIQELQQSHKSAKLSQKRLNETISRLKDESTQKVQRLQAKNREVSAQLKDSTLQLAQVREENEAKSKQTEVLAKRLEATERAYESKIRDLQADYSAKKQADQKRFLENLAKEKLSAEKRLAREQEYRRQAEGEAKAHNQKLGELKSSLEGTKAELASLNKQKSRLNAEKTELTARAAQLQGDLERTKAVANYKRELAERIRKNLRAAGIHAEVDSKTGDVTLTFENEYFDTNEARLKPGMRKILDRFMPTYTNSLFSDNKIAQEIRGVELVGFASPTYQRRYVDPSSLNAADRKAVNYNLDLSYQRAKSIFNYIFDTSKIRYSNQERLLPMVKVTGRSYLAAKRKDGSRMPSSVNADTFCKEFNCLESQKVIIRFNFEE